MFKWFRNSPKLYTYTVIVRSADTRDMWCTTYGEFKSAQHAVAEAIARLHIGPNENFDIAVRATPDYNINDLYTGVIKECIPSTTKR